MAIWSGVGRQGSGSRSVVKRVKGLGQSLWSGIRRQGSRGQGSRSWILVLQSQGRVRGQVFV